MPPDFRSNNPDVNDALDNENQVIEECVNCGCSVDEDESRHNNDSEVHCEECYDEHYFSCNDCGEETSNQDAQTSDTGSDICSDCFDDNYDYCDGCDETLHRDDMVWNDSRGAYMCESCDDENRESDVEWEVMSNSYVRTRSDFLNPTNSGYSMHKGRLIKQTDPNMMSVEDRNYKKAKKWMKDSHDIIKSKRYVGLELEVNLDNDYYDYDDDYYDEINYNLQRRLGMSRHVLSAISRRIPYYQQGNFGFNVVGDSSVTSGNHPIGCEVVTGPRRGDIIDADIRTICKSLKDDNHAYISSNCGLHLHVDTSDFDFKHFSVLTTLTKLIEPHVYTWLPSSRRNSRWSAPISQDYRQLRDVYDRDDFINAWYDGNSYYPEKYHDKRYHGLNLHSHFYAQQGSEIRYHSGTLNPDKIKHWVVFWTQVFDTAYEIANAWHGPLPGTNFYKTLMRQDKIKLSDRERKILSKYTRHETTLTDYHKIKSDPELHILYRKLRDYHGLSTDVSLYGIVYGYHYLNPWYGRQDKCLTFDSMMDLFDIPKSTRDFYYNRYYDRRNDEYFDHNHLKRCYGKIDQWYEYCKETQTFTLVDDTRNRLVKWDELGCRRPRSNRNWRYTYEEADVQQHVCRLVHQYVNYHVQTSLRYNDHEYESMELRREWIREQYSSDEYLEYVPFG
tara:strand:+ start:8848 stop:10863 length:2016 start_codon:yes stop_codon:yes gene_type:complete